ncbi:MAG TPA: transglycosylase SLT domain-containing protein [Pyrinomonadaceae bacterium]|mgnify:CR=1 FL=1|nr:transglycosylase SLT domain-containing protein [Pyrinomonadaceae bacterium]
MIKANIVIAFLIGAFTISCSAQQTEEQALKSLRDITSTGKLPAENVVAEIAKRFEGKRTGALARLLQARIRFENKDFAGAAALLDSDVFKTKTKLADHALWMRGQALAAAGDHGAAMEAFQRLISEHADSIRVRDAKLAWAASAITSGRAVEVPPMLVELTEKKDGDALLATAKAYEAQGSQAEATNYYRRTYFYAAGSSAAKEAEAKLTSLGQQLVPQNADEIFARADRLLSQKSFADAANTYVQLANSFPASLTPQTRLRRLTALAQAGRMNEAVDAMNSLPTGAAEREDGQRQLVLGYAKAKQWPAARAAAETMRASFPNGKLVAKTFIDAGLIARDSKMRIEEAFYFNTAVASFPNAIEIAQAQFEASWVAHENGNFALSSQMLTEHLARYAGKDTANRGTAGYWAARDSERAGKTAEACALYDGVVYRYNANWYGYLAISRLAAMRSQGKCPSTQAPNDLVARAVANLKVVSVAAETAGPNEKQRVEKSDELSIVGLFDWSIAELNEAKKTAANSPSINLALARHYRWKGDNTAAFVALKNSYPDYAQMFPEEMGREEWAVFYPQIHWNDIKYWAGQRGLDMYQVAGVIRQESVFMPRAASPAKAYGLMQLIMPTAISTARKYGASVPSSPEMLFGPTLNIELGTAYMKDQLAKYGRLEYMAVAYNAGPGRVPQWRATLPAEIDEFVEEIPFKETKQYVQGVIRNTAQYRRLYDENGNFRANVGTKPLRGEIDSKPRDQFLAENPEVIVDESAE